MPATRRAMRRVPGPNISAVHSAAPRSRAGALKNAVLSSPGSANVRPYQPAAAPTRAIPMSDAARRQRPKGARGVAAGAGAAAGARAADGASAGADEAPAAGAAPGAAAAGQSFLGGP